MASPRKISEILNTGKNIIVFTFPFHSVPALETHKMHGTRNQAMD